MTKLAVCMSGNMRTYRKSFTNQVKNIYNKYDCDIFISTWTDPSEDWANVINLYNPISLVIESPIQFEDNYNNKYKNNSNLSVISMYYKILQCNNLRINHEINTNKVYDYVIRIRPDTILNSAISETELKNSIDNLFVTAVGQEIWMDDGFAFSSSNNINLYSLTYNYLHEFYQLANSLHPETMAKLCCDKHNIKVKVSNIKTGLLRDNDQIASHHYHGPLEEFFKL